MKKNKDNLFTFIISIVVVIIPILVGFIIWNKLPDELPTHWDIHGEPDQYSSRLFAVLFMPLILLALHIIVNGLFVLRSNDKVSNKIIRIFIWICPLMSVFVSTITYVTALGQKISIPLVAMLFVGLIFLVLGNYIPKARQNKIFGIRIKWTLESKANWEATSRMSGWLLCFLGIISIILGIISVSAKTEIIFIIYMACVVITFVAVIAYSGMYRKKHKDNPGYFNEEN